MSARYKQDMNIKEPTKIMKFWSSDRHHIRIVFHHQPYLKLIWELIFMSYSDSKCFQQVPTLIFVHGFVLLVIICVVYHFSPIGVVNYNCLYMLESIWSVKKSKYSRNSMQSFSDSMGDQSFKTIYIFFMNEINRFTAS